MNVQAEVGRVVGVPALSFSVLAALAGIGQYTRFNAEQCAGGLGRLGTGLALYAVLALALLLTSSTLVVTLVVAIAGRRWAWSVGLVAVAAAAVLLTVGADSQVSRTLVGSILGFGCATTNTEVELVVRCFAPLLVAVPCLVCLMTRRGSDRHGD